MGRIATKRADSTPENPKFDVVIWGTVSKDAELTFTKQQEIPKVVFGVSYDRKTYMNCITLKDTPTARVAADLRKGDTVLCMGVWSSRTYKGRDGNEKTWAELLCEVIIRQPDVFYGQDETYGENQQEDGTSADASDTYEYEEPEYELTI